MKHMAIAAQGKNVYEVECLDPNGQVKWVETIENIIPNVGLDDILDKVYKASGYTATWYVGLTSTTPSVNAADTMASHGGWTEPTDYDEAVRQTLTLGAVAAQSVSNTASKASFSINATVTLGGCFITTDNTKGGTSGILGGVGAFSTGDKAASSGDTLRVTVTLTQASA